MGAVAVQDDALLGALAAFRSLDKVMRKQVQQQTQATLSPLFTTVYQQRAAEAGGRSGQGSARQDLAMAGRKPAKVSLTIGGKGSLKGYTSGRALSGGMRPSTDWPWVEFGTYGPWAEYGRLPWWKKGGRVFYPTVKAFAPVAQRAYLFALYETLRSIQGVED